MFPHRDFWFNTSILKFVRTCINLIWQLTMEVYQLNIIQSPLTFNFQCVKLLPTASFCRLLSRFASFSLLKLSSLVGFFNLFIYFCFPLWLIVQCILIMVFSVDLCNDYVFCNGWHDSVLEFRYDCQWFNFRSWLSECVFILMSTYRFFSSICCLNMYGFVFSYAYLDLNIGLVVVGIRIKQ